MNLTLDYTLSLIRYLLAFAIILQSIEFLQIKQTFNNNGIWRLATIQSDYDFLPMWAKAILNNLLDYNTFIKIIWLRLLLAIIIVFYSNAFLIFGLIIISLLISIRWRGTFNGGSDYMTLIALISLFIANLTTNQQYQKAGIYYLCFQVAMSYFLAGFAKIRNKEWRNGKALQTFANNTIYKENDLIAKLISKKSLCVAASYTVICWELLFPIAFANQNIAIIFLSIGCIFHLANTYSFGLNRFFWVWLSAYPAIIYLAGKLLFL